MKWKSKENNVLLHIRARKSNLCFWHETWIAREGRYLMNVLFEKEIKETAGMNFGRQKWQKRVNC